MISSFQDVCRGSEWETASVSWSRPGGFLAFVWYYGCIQTNVYISEDLLPCCHVFAMLSRSVASTLFCCKNFKMEICEKAMTSV